MKTTSVNLLLFGIIQVTLKIPILCPAEQERGCTGTGSIRSCGRDKNHAKLPYRYLCGECGKSFYAHTSKLFKQFSRKQQFKIMLRIAKTGSKHTDIANEFGISTAAASRLATKFRKFLKNNLKSKYGYYYLEQQRRAVNTAKSNSVIIDETFVRIEGKQYYIIVAVNGYSEILCWKLVQKRNWVELVKLFAVLFEMVDDLGLIITDGFNAYCKALRNLPFSFHLIHVQHIHKHPRGTIKIRYVQRDYDAKVVYEFSWLTQSQIFKKYQGKSCPSSYISLTSIRITLFRMKSLPASIFDTAYRRRRASTQLKRFKKLFKIKKYRRSKAYNDEGQVFLFKEIPMAFEISYHGYQQSRPFVNLEQSCQLTALLGTLFTSVLMQISLMFAGKSITSNLIESLFGNFDLAIARSGRHDFVNYDASFASWFSLRSLSSSDLVGDTTFTDFNQYSQSSAYSLNQLNDAIEVDYWNAAESNASVGSDVTQNPHFEGIKQLLNVSVT